MHSAVIDRWAFRLGDERGASAKGFDDAAWRRVRVPHDWSVEQPFAEEHSSGTGYLPGGIGWYRAHVPFTAAPGQHVRLVFHGVYRDAEVWVNGYHLGARPSGFARFSFDLTEIASYAPDDDLVIAVRVSRLETADSRWFNGTGLNRRVELEVHEPVHLREHGTVVTTERADVAEAVVRVVQRIANDTDAAVVVAVRHELRSLSTDRSHAFEAEVTVPARTEAIAVAVVTIADPELWTDTDPRLHRLTSTLSWTTDGAAQRAEYTEIVGIRTIRFDPDHGFSVNGERRVLRGVCLHDDGGPFGTAVPADVWLRRLLTLREMGANAVRMAHNPHSPELYALCDVLGLFVIDEAFDEWENPKNKWWQGHNVYPPKHDGPAREFPEWHERDLTAMVEAHRNHPSVIAWSIGNEVDYPNDPYAHPLFQESVGNNDAGKPAAERVYDPNRPDIRRLTTIAKRLGAIVRAADPTRPVTLAAAFPELSSRTGLLDDLDLVGYNYREARYAEDHARFPDKPFVGSETSHRYVDWLAVVRNEWVAGQFLWTGVDFLGETTLWPNHGSRAGLLTIAGFPKPGYHLRRSWWAEEPVAHVVLRPAGEDGDLREGRAVRGWNGRDPLQVLAFANGDEVELRWGDERIPLERDEEHGWWSAVATPRAEPLVLEIRRDGRTVARDEVRTAGPAERVEATAWRAPEHVASAVRAAGLPLDELLQVEVRLVDGAGEPAGDDRLVAVAVEGGELLGIESGDLADPTPYPSTERRTRDGRLIVFVRPAGSTAITLRAEGLDEVLIRDDSARFAG
ncbi:glycoside hydrolase family 2 TIM barrel-domain containing protein [Amnibacterium kyonggiense]|uniref:Glycosyl hydrolase family 2 n=1 Tax=Amnibacterium kyonggiense TaxID=595671 RepID=A0A4R7FMM8_9MICO|nr:glycoside hydrolase family 2 TIM barrel-domain containing protein [Amnibacterium kyonggiense]TDS77589.1 glycosyl hydrolase family 2 [Amnibacterium kyonggiense]